MDIGKNKIVTKRSENKNWKLKRMKITIEKIVTADTIKKQLPFPIFFEDN